MARIFVAIFLVVPLIEIALFITIGRAIGVWPTLLGVLVTAIVGSAVVRSQGGAILAEIRATVAEGRLPARSLADGMLVGLAGLLLLLPGYFTDLVGLMLLIPPLRTLFYGWLARHFTVSVAPGGGFSARSRPRGTIDLDADHWRQQ